ncbi:hypothetical protein SAMN04489761_0781 [Tenacibaculum sp. MAR_2009_124]|uniref:hypothetical protein n=1 Tax=Tenacibaculum sp. MAR_2009_124 TaxID=1250059 RepID=UPI00089ABB2F|nr:hypothetical protein [Tenacibaculum sp. MAR_2009_124]SEB44873.1 hypothetical protein SAMN04489761_0781 [Tenacibaculum sp. MAR_2009_124]
MRKLSFIAIVLVGGLFTACTNSSDEMLSQPQQIEVEEMSTGGTTGGNGHDTDPEPDPNPKDSNDQTGN